MHHEKAAEHFICPDRKQLSDPGISCRYAKGFLLGKIYNARWVLERATRDHPQRVPVEKLKTLSGQLAAALPRVEDAMTTEELRGIEGEASQLYFSGFDDLILQQRPAFAFAKRTRRPPLDPVNALLSFAYTLLARDCAAALEGAGLDSYVGFLHRPRPGRTSLALDLMEELRTAFADRFVLACINQKTILPKHCIKQESGAVLLTDEGRRAFLQAWQQRRQQTIQHPFLGEKIPLGTGALCAGFAAGPHPAGRSGPLSPIFLEIRRALCWFWSLTTSTPKPPPGGAGCARLQKPASTTANGCRTLYLSASLMPRSTLCSRQSSPL